jgi:hypothetical protein
LILGAKNGNFCGIKAGNGRREGGMDEGQPPCGVLKQRFFGVLFGNPARIVCTIFNYYIKNEAK